MNVRVRLRRKLSAEELLLLNCGAGEDSWDPWTARKSNQSILKEINFEYSLEGLMLKLKLQYFGHLMQKPTHWKRPWCWKRLKAKRQEGSRGWGCLKASPTKWTWIWADFRRSWRTEKPGVLQSMESQSDMISNRTTFKTDKITGPRWLHWLFLWNT